jgi:hypothetical protein
VELNRFCSSPATFTGLVSVYRELVGVRFGELDFVGSGSWGFFGWFLNDFEGWN